MRWPLVWRSRLDRAQWHLEEQQERLLTQSKTIRGLLERQENGKFALATAKAAISKLEAAQAELAELRQRVQVLPPAPATPPGWPPLECAPPATSGGAPTTKAPSSTRPTSAPSSSTSDAPPKDYRPSPQRRSRPK